MQMQKKKPATNDHNSLVVILWRCFIRQPPAQDDHFCMVARVVILYRFDVNNKISRLHERALQIVYNDHESSFEQFLIEGNSFYMNDDELWWWIHHQNIHRLMIEIYEIFNNMTNVYYKDHFVRSSHDFSLWSQQDLVIPSVNSVCKGKSSLRHFGSVIWNSLPNEIRHSETLSVFKSKIRVLNL